MPTYRVKTAVQNNLPKEAVLVQRLTREEDPASAEPFALFFKAGAEVDLANAVGRARKLIDDFFNPGFASFAVIELDV